MVQLFKNVIRDMSKNILQILSICIFIFLMTALLSGIVFSNHYVWDQYQKIQYGIKPENRINDFNSLNFRNHKIGEKQREFYWENMLYTNYDENTKTFTLDENKFKLATLKIENITIKDTKEILNQNNLNYFTKKQDYIYKVTYCNGKDINIGCNQNRVNDRGYFYIDSTFYNGNNSEEKNYFNYDDLFKKYSKLPTFNLITTSNEEILKQINNKFNITTNSNLINEHKKLYWIIINSLFYDRMEVENELIVNDLLTSGKIYVIKKFTNNDMYGRPYIIDWNGQYRHESGNYGFIFKRFAKLNNLKLGDEVEVAGLKVKIDGYATNQNYFYFQLQSGTLPNLFNSTAIWVNEQTYNNLNSQIFKTIKQEKNAFYLYERSQAKTINAQKLNKLQFFSAFDNSDLRIICDTSNVNYNAISDRLNLINSIAIVFSILLIIITITIIFILLFKIINRNQAFLGTVKVFGGSMGKITLSLSLAVIWPILVSSIIGTIMGILFMYFINLSYRDFFILVEYGIDFYWIDILKIIFIPLLIVFVVAFIFTYLILKKPVLQLLNPHFKKSKLLKINKILAIKWQWVSYKTKITWSFFIKSFVMVLFSFLTITASATLFYFTLSTNEMSANLLSRQWSGIKFNYAYGYKNYDSDLKKWQEDPNYNQPTYKFHNVKSLLAKANIYQDLLENFNTIRDNKNYNFYGKWIYAHQLKILVNWINSDDQTITLNNGIKITSNLLPHRQQLRKLINEKEYLKNYLIGENNPNASNLIISFGNIIYNDNDSLMWTGTSQGFGELLNYYSNRAEPLMEKSPENVDKSLNYNVNSEVPFFKKISNIKYDPKLMTYYSINEINLKHLNPQLTYGNISNFINLTERDWTEKVKTIEKVNKIALEQLTRQGFEYEIIPVIVSRNYTNYGKLIYPKLNQSFESRKIILHYVNDYIENLQNTIITPQHFFQKAYNLPSDFYNSKLSSNDKKDFHNYFTIVNNNNYNLLKNNVINEEGWENLIVNFLDINSKKNLSERFNNSISTLILSFGIFALILALTVIFIFCNIILKENITFINVFRVFGYSKKWISSLFWKIYIPIIVLSCFIASFLAEPLINFLIKIIFLQTGVLFPVIFYWWFYLTTFLVISITFAIAFTYSWFINLKKTKITTINN